ncbi:hemolysin-III related-domain-containing protein [Plectosphaerella cucumerina]|uniref:Hemolysin-III related-domain-containing protein n=1 Tax=Plectosphaerella cucumerina TaxID=40658 RepID=A0A8K0TPM7_9PEZI|nr:hemolysin-III related-domain-containing protein [Plectosphaerella cucumerina]
MEAPVEIASLLSRRSSPTPSAESPRIAYATANDLKLQLQLQHHQQQQQQQQQNQPRSPPPPYTEKEKAAGPSSSGLRTIAEVPAWYAANQHILTGYRPLTPSVRFCLASLGSLHNETINIYSHLIPGALALVGNAAILAYFRTHFPGALLADQLVFHIFLTGSVTCFGVSAAYHALLCHSKKYHDLWLRLDYLAIIVQILGSFISGIYMGFYCEPGPRALHWGMIGCLSFATTIVMLHPGLQSQEYRLLRLYTFVATGLSGFAPVFHAMALFPHDQLEKHMGVRYYYLEGIFILTGALIYGLHFPEKWYPFRFDIFGASHQIFHICVVLGAASHFYGILSAYQYTYEHPRCPA